MSIAVLRTFISKRKEEHEALLSKRAKKALQVSENNASEIEAGASGMERGDELITQNGSSNGEAEPSVEIPEGEPCSNVDEAEKVLEGKGRAELKPPRVLEVLVFVFFFS